MMHGPMNSKDMKDMEKIFTSSGCLRTESLNTGVQNPTPRTVFLTLCYADPLQSLVNLLKPTGHVMHQQFNIQQLYALPTLYLCVLYFI